MASEPITALVLFRALHTPPLTQADVAKMVGVPTPTFCRWETGARELKGKNLILVSRKTGIPIPELRPDLAAMFQPAA